MASYSKNEARAWALENLRGVANVVIPTFTQDLKRLNETAIRYDIEKEIEYGFYGTLLVSEVAISVEEYARFVSVAAETAAGRLCLIHHAAFGTLQENIEAVQAAEKHGAELILLSYPANYHPTSEQEIYDYTKSFCDSTNLGVMIFPVPLWGFERLHPAGMSPELVDRMVDNIHNIVAIKAESGMPTIGGFVQAWRKYEGKIVVSMPLEAEALMLAALVPLKFSGTSNTEFFGPMIPRIFKLMQNDQFDEAMELYWQIHPARMANMHASAYVPQTLFLNRMLWKYQGWLSGFNGGPLRQPTMKVSPRTMADLRRALTAAGLDPTPEPDSEFFIGRNPE